MTEGGEEDSLAALFPPDGEERLPELSPSQDGLPSLAALVARADPAVLMGAASANDGGDPLDAFLATFEGVDPTAVVPPMGGDVGDASATGDLWLAAQAAAVSVADGAVPAELPTPPPMVDHDGLGGGGGGWLAAAPLPALVTVEGDDGAADVATALSPVSTVAPDVMDLVEPAPPVPALAPLVAVAPAPPAPVAPVPLVPGTAAVAVPPGASATSLASDTSRVTGSPAARAAAVAAAAGAYMPAVVGPPSAGSAATADPWAGSVAPAGTAGPPARGLSAVERAQQAAEDIAVAEVASRRAKAAKAKRARGDSGTGEPAKKRARGAGAGNDAAAEDDDNGGEEEAEAGEAAADAAVAGATGSDAEKSRRYQKRLQKNRDSAFVSRIRRRHYTAILETSLKKEEEEKRSLGGEVAQLRSQVEALKAQLVAYRAPAAKDGAYGVPSSVVATIAPSSALPAGMPPASGSASSSGHCPPSSSAAVALFPAPLGGRSSPVSSSTSGAPEPYRLPGPTVRTRLGATVASRTAARPSMVTTLLVAAVILGFCVPVAFLPEIASVAAGWAARPLARWATSDGAVASVPVGLFDTRQAQTSSLRGPVADALPWPKQEQCVPGEEAAWSPRLTTPPGNDDVDVVSFARDSDPPPVVPADSDSERCMVSADAFFDRIFIRDERDATSSSSRTTAAARGGGTNGGGSSAGPLPRPLPELSPTSPPRRPVAGPAPAGEPPVWAPQPTALSLSLWAKDRGRGSRTPTVGDTVPAPLPAPVPHLPATPARMPQLFGGVGGGGSGDGSGSGTSGPRPRVRAWSANASDGAAAAAASPPLLGGGGRVWAAAARSAGLVVDAATAADAAARADEAAPLHLLCDELASVVDTSVGGWPAGGSAQLVKREPGGSQTAAFTASSGASSSSRRGTSNTQARLPEAAAASPPSAHARSAYKGKAPARWGSLRPLPPPHSGGGGRSHGGGDGAAAGPPSPPPPALLSTTAAAVVSRPWRAARPWAAGCGGT